MKKRLVTVAVVVKEYFVEDYAGNLSMTSAFLSVDDEETGPLCDTETTIMETPIVLDDKQNLGDELDKELISKAVDAVRG